MALTKVWLPFGPWEPDAAAMGGTHSTGARNAVPSATGWRPFHASFPLRFGAVPGRVLAAHARRDGDAAATFASTSGGIYALEDGVWAAKHEGEALSATRAFADFGPSVYALYGTQLMRSVLEGGVASAFQPVEGAPHASVMGVVRDFLVLGRLSGSPEGEGGIRWSGLDSPDSWPEPGSDEAQYLQADVQIFPTGGRVQAIVGGVGGADGLIFLERGIQRAVYVGAPYLFQFEALDRSRGLLAPQSAVLCGNTCCFLSADGWFATDGTSLRPVGLGRVDRWFFENCENSRLSETRGVYDVRRRLALWTFASPAAPDGLHDRALIYSCELDRWGWAELDCEAILADWTRGCTLDELDSFGSLDDLPFASLDSPVLRHGRQGAFVFDGSHRLCSLEGAPLPALFDTPEHGKGRVFLHGLRPMVDGGRAEAMPVWRERTQDARRFGSWSAPGRDGICPQRLSARRLGARVRVAAGESWDSALGVEALVEEEGGA